VEVFFGGEGGGRGRQAEKFVHAIYMHETSIYAYIFYTIAFWRWRGLIASLPTTLMLSLTLNPQSPSGALSPPLSPSFFGGEGDYPSAYDIDADRHLEAPEHLRLSPHFQHLITKENLIDLDREHES